MGGSLLRHRLLEGCLRVGLSYEEGCCWVGINITKEYTRIGVYSFVVLFEIVFEIVSDFLHEMDAVFAHDIVFGAGVDEIVDRNVVGDASVEKIE